MLAFVSPGDLEEYERLLDEQKAEAAAKKPAKPFVHREPPPSKCGTCQLAVTRQQKRICEASGMPVIETSGISACAYLPIRKVSND